MHKTLCQVLWTLVHYTDLEPSYGPCSTYNLAHFEGFMKISTAT